MIPRILEPEAMDTPAEAADYDAMDHSVVNERFAADFLDTHGPCRGGEVLDVGTGTARIPIALCRVDPEARVVGLDLAEAMLELAGRNVNEAGLSDRIRLERGDGKGLAHPSATFEAVVSNTIVHHIPDPSPALAEMARVVAPGGTLFVRDLARPDTLEDVHRLVDLHASGESPRACALFEASLHAALTVGEVQSLVVALGLPADGVTMTSDRHWTWTWRRPPAPSNGEATP